MSAVHATPPEMIVEQVRQVAADIGVDAVKIGMLGTAETVRAVDEALDLLEPGTPIVIDPVMVAESGAVLLDDDARAALIDLLLPRATVITPNLPEARVLAGDTDAAEDAEPLARALHRLGPDVVVVTGGHREEVADVFFDGSTLETLTGTRHPDGAAHGSGCTHSSALAAHLALGHGPLDAARAARAIASDAVRDGLREIGAGAGPSTCSVSGTAALKSARRNRGARHPSGIIGSMKFLRMRPGHGEQLIAEGDVGVAEDEERLVEMFRRQLDDGMWAAVPTTTRPAAGRRRWCAPSRRSRGTPTASSSSRARPAAPGSP